MNRCIILLLIVATLVTGLACPAESDVIKAFKTSATIGELTAESAKFTLELYDNKVIDYDTKEKIVSKLKLVGKHGQMFHNQIKVLNEQYGDRLPDSQVKALDILFNREVVTPLLELLNDVGILPGDVSSKVFAGLRALRSAVLLIANLFVELRST